MRSLGYDDLRSAGLPRPRLIISGFLELWIDPDHMFHIWDERLAIETRANIHDHNYDFESRIVLGKLEHTIWVPDPEAKDGYRVDRVDVYERGDRYEFLRGQFHTIRPLERPAATFVTKVWRPDVPPGVKSGRWKNTDEQEELFWRVIRDALDGSELEKVVKQNN